MCRHGFVACTWHIKSRKRTTAKTQSAKVAELADALVLGTSGVTRGSSSLPFRTTKITKSNEQNENLNQTPAQRCGLNEVDRTNKPAADRVAKILIWLIFMSEFENVSRRLVDQDLVTELEVNNGHSY